MTNIKSQLRFALLLPVLILVLGTSGYMLIEGWSVLDSFYMTIISITTTGFKEVHSLSNTGRIFTLFIIILGVGSIAYIGGRSFQNLLETQIFRRKKMSKKIDAMKDHFIVCGYGRMGRYICEELADEKASFVVIESNDDKLEMIIEKNYVYVKGDATKDEILTLAGIARAKGLVAVVSNDAQNVFTILSARGLNPNIFIVARAVEEETEPKLIKAGANRVVKPYEAGGTRMAELLLRPNIIELIDIVARDKTVDLHLESINVKDESRLANIGLGDSPIRKDTNAIIIAIQKIDGKFIYNPNSSTVIQPGDRLFALGEKNNLEKLIDLCNK